MDDDIDTLLRDHVCCWNAAEPDEPDVLPVAGEVRGPGGWKGLLRPARLVAVAAACLWWSLWLRSVSAASGGQGRPTWRPRPRHRRRLAVRAPLRCLTEARLAPGVRGVISSAELYDVQLSTVPGEDGVWAVGAVPPRPSGQGTGTANWHAAIWHYDDTSGRTSRWTVELRHTRGLPPPPFPGCRSRAWVGDGTTLVVLANAGVRRGEAGGLSRRFVASTASVAAR